MKYLEFSANSEVAAIHINTILTIFDVLCTQLGGFPNSSLAFPPLINL